MELVLQIRRGMISRLWQAAKGNYAGTGGYNRFLQVVAVLLIVGSVEGCVGHSPREEWWQQGVLHARQMGIEEECEQALEDEGKELATEAGGMGRNVGTTGPNTRRGSKVDVVVDWMAGSQSLRRAVPKETLYLPFDKQEYVYSAEQGWVRNIMVDLVAVKGAQLWQEIQDEVVQRCGDRAVVERLFLAMSPCCKTFTKADSTNISRGHNYRRSGADFPTRPLKDDTSAKGRAACEADRMVKRGIEVARHLSRVAKAKFYMENPEGGLCRRLYMRGWERWEEDKVRRVEVHYCAYEHHYHKPTHLWTNL